VKVIKDNRANPIPHHDVLSSDPAPSTTPTAPHTPIIVNPN
ncbi:uncharacterized protein METZ01_LOCUS31947, partial [marine metagenome]